MNRTLRNTTGALAVFGVVALTALGSTSPAAAAAGPKPPVLTVTGDGSWTTDDAGAAVVTGPAEVQLRTSGDPLPATLTAVLTPEDGTLPDPETCEPASARFTVAGVRAARMTLAGTGTVCGVYPQLPTYVVTQVFTGRYTVIDAARCKLRGTDGFFEVRLGLGRVGAVERYQRSSRRLLPGTAMRSSRVPGLYS